MKLGPKLHRMNDDRLLIRIIVQTHHLEQPTRAIRSDDEIAALACDHSKGDCEPRARCLHPGSRACARYPRSPWRQGDLVSRWHVMATSSTADNGARPRNDRLPGLERWCGSEQRWSVEVVGHYEILSAVRPGLTNVQVTSAVAQNILESRPSITATEGRPQSFDQLTGRGRKCSVQFATALAYTFRDVR